MVIRIRSASRSLKLIQKGMLWRTGMSMLKGMANITRLLVKKRRRKAEVELIHFIRGVVEES